jgi:hypothetical protein
MSRIFSHRYRQSRRAAFQRLEDRCMLAVGTFIENFSDDFASFQTYEDVVYATTAGFDSWDNSPATQPPAADEMHIINDLPLFGGNTPPLNGPTPGGYYAVESERLDPQDPASPPVHLLRLYDTADPGLPNVTFEIQPVGPGGLQTGEIIAGASVRVRGIGSVTYVGQNDTRTVAISSSRNTLTVSAFTGDTGIGGNRLGPIHSIKLQSEEFLEVDNVTFLVLEDNFAPIANDDAAAVFMGESVTFNWRENDLVFDGNAITVTWTQPERGRVEMDAVTGLGTYFADPDPAHIGRYTFEYTISDGQGRTDTATVFIDVTNVRPNRPAVGLIRADAAAIQLSPPGETNYLPGPFRWRVAYDVDGDPLSATLTAQPLHGSVQFRSLPPDETGRSWLEAHYVPFHPHYGPYDGSLKFNDRFAFDVTDGKHFNRDGTLISDRGLVQILNSGVSIFEPIARNDLFTFNADQPIDPARPGWLIIDVPGVLANDDFWNEAGEPVGNFTLRPIYAELVTLPESGILLFRDNGSFDYLPDPNRLAQPNPEHVVSFTYWATDGVHRGNEATVTLRITTDRAPPSQRWSNLVARSDHIFATPDPSGLTLTIDLTALESNDVNWDSRFPGLHGAIAFGHLSSMHPNGNYIEYLTAVANEELDFPAADNTVRQEIRLTPETRGAPLFEGVTFGRYRLVIKDGVDRQYSNWANFYVELGAFDTDGDGISDWTEFRAQDSLDDASYLSSSRVLVPNAEDGRVAVLDTDGAPFFGVSTSAPLAEPPAGVDFPIGFFQFGVIPPSSGATVIVTITPPPGVQLTSYWKFGLEPDDPSTTDDDWKKQPHWYEFTFDEATQTGAIPGPEGSIALYLRDGQRGDYDVEVNGFIYDPGGPALGIPPLPGDYNIDGAADAADYVVWRKTLGQSVFDYTFADGNGDAIVDEDDYGVWRANFGATLSPVPGAGAVAEPPAEPGAVGLAVELASFGETARQPPALPGVATSAGRAASFAAIEIESRRQDWRPPSRGSIARSRFADFSGDELLLLAIDRAERARQHDAIAVMNRQHPDAHADADDVGEDGISRKRPMTLTGTFL